MILYILSLTFLSSFVHSQGSTCAKTQKECAPDVNNWKNAQGNWNGCSPVTCWNCPGTVVPGQCNRPHSMQGGMHRMSGFPGSGGGSGNIIQNFMRMAAMEDPEDPMDQMKDYWGDYILPTYGSSIFRGPGGQQAYQAMAMTGALSSPAMIPAGTVPAGREIRYIASPEYQLASSRPYIQPVVYPDGQVQYYPVNPYTGLNQINSINQRMSQYNTDASSTIA